MIVVDASKFVNAEPVCIACVVITSVFAFKSIVISASCIVAVLSLPENSAVAGTDIGLISDAVGIEVVGLSSVNSSVCGRACDVFVNVDGLEADGMFLVSAVLVAVIRSVVCVLGRMNSLGS